MNKSPADILAAIDAEKKARPAYLGAPGAPLDAIDQTLVGIWAEVLRIDRVGATDNFFHLGGDSIHMTQIASRLRSIFGVEVPFTAFFEDPTISGISRVTRAALGKPEPVTEVPGSGEDKHRVTFEHFSHEWTIRGAEPVEKINVLVIPTRDRPDAFARCLTSYAANLRHYGRSSCRIAVADNSDSETASNQNLDIAQRVGRSFQMSIRFYGRAEREAYKTELSRADIDPETIDFAFGACQQDYPRGAGAPRNFLQMVAAGEAFISVDDDTECIFARRPDFRVAVEECDGAVRDPAILSVYPNRDALLKDVVLCEIDFVAAHEQLLGRRGQLGGRVGITLTGVAGDCGWGSPSRYFDYSDQWANMPSGWAAAVSSRETMRSTNSFVVSARADLLMTTAFGVSSRFLVPPFPPTGRGSDMVFGKLMKLTNPTTLFGHLPWGVIHTAAEPRRFWPGEHFRSAGTTDISGMLCLLADEPRQGESGPHALRSLATRLRDISRASNADFTLLLKERAQSTAEPFLATIEGYASRLQDGVSDWAADALLYVAKARKALAAPLAGIPVELLYGKDADEAVSSSRLLTARFADLLDAWPQMLNAARQLK